MTRFEIWAVHISTLLVGGTGLAYAALAYLVPTDDPYAIVNHPWQPHLQHAHLWVAPALVFSVGLIWKEHIWRHFSSGAARRRRSGIGMLLTLVPMVVSGYLIQTAFSAQWRTAWVVVHLVTSSLWLGAFGTHLVLQRRHRSSALRQA